MNPLITAGLVLLAIVLTVAVMAWIHNRPKPAVIARVEAEVAQDGWKLLAKTVAAVADSSGKQAALANATADLAEHFENVRKLKAAVAALPEA